MKQQKHSSQPLSQEAIACLRVLLGGRMSIHSIAAQVPISDATLLKAYEGGVVSRMAHQVLESRLKELAAGKTAAEGAAA